MNTDTALHRDRPRESHRGSVLIVTLVFAAVIGISLVSYTRLCTNSLKLSHRTLFANTAGNLVEAGLEEAVWSFNQMGSGSATAWNGWTTDTTKLAAIIVTNGGTGYSSAPTVTISGGGGTGAAATSLVDGGTVTLVRVTNRGSGFTAAPTVTFSGGGGSGVAATATNMAATRTLPTFDLDQNAHGVVKVFAAGYDGSISTPLVVAQATITPFDGAPIVKITQVTLQFNGPFVNGVVARSGITWNGHPMADSWISNPSNSPTGPWSSYPGTGARANNTVADLTGSVGLGALGVVNGDLKLGSAVTYGGTGTVSGTITNNFTYPFAMPTYPTSANLDNYYNLGSAIPAALPRVLDQPNTNDGRYYYFAVAGVFPAATTISGGRKVTIVGSGTTNVTGTVTIPADGSLYVYTDGTINARYVNNSWAGALQLYTTTTAGTTLNGNDNIRACIFAPNSPITGNGGGSSGAFYGAFVGSSVTSNGHMDFHYDESLGRIASAKPWSLTIWRELQSATERSAYSLQLGF